MQGVFVSICFKFSRNFIKAFQSYSNLCGRSPFKMTIISSSVILGLGDYIMQRISRRRLPEQDKKTWKLDQPRLLNMVKYGLLIGGFNYCWYVRLLPYLSYRQGQTLIRETLVKIFFDQALYSPFYYTFFL